MELLDNQNVISQRDPEDALGIAAHEWEQLFFGASIQNNLQSENHEITKIVVAGMGGSALAASLAKDWLDLYIPFEVVRNYMLPKYVDESTLVIASSYSGNTEEILSALSQARAAGAQIAILASAGELLRIAKEEQIPYIQLPSGPQPRMEVFSNLTALIAIFEAYGILSDVTLQLRDVANSLQAATNRWTPDIDTTNNQAKQLALEMVGKIPVIYASNLMGSVAYKWKISFNESAKNVAFYNVLPEFNHNEFMGWTSHPVQKPFGVIDLVSSFDHEQIKKRFEISDRLLSGMRPHAHTVELQGASILEQMLWGSILADFVSIYLAILNGVDPTPVDLIEKFKLELR